MIDFYKFLTLASLLIVLNSHLTNGENKYKRNLWKVKNKSSLSKHYIKPNHQMGDQSPEVAETRAQHSIVSASDHDLSAAAGHGYHQYAKVPHKGSWEFGYKRGNPHHHREQHEQGHGGNFKTKLKWHDGKGGHGEHYWDYNHGGHGGHGGGGGQGR